MLSDGPRVAAEGGNVNDAKINTIIPNKTLLKRKK